MNKKPSIILAIIILGLLLIRSFAQPAENEKVEFSGIVFKTRYQTVKIDTPILVEMEIGTRLLAITLRNPKTAKFKFLMKITPRDFETWQKLIKNEAKDLFLLNSQKAYFVLGKGKIKIDEVTINTESFEWLKQYQNLIEKNFKKCSSVLTPDGYSDVACPPLLIEAKIIRIERSDFNNQETYFIPSEKKERLRTGSPTLPEEYKFPHTDYFDIYIEILSIRK